MRSREMPADLASAIAIIRDLDRRLAAYRETALIIAFIAAVTLLVLGNAGGTHVTIDYDGAYLVEERWWGIQSKMHPIRFTPEGWEVLQGKTWEPLQIEDPLAGFSPQDY